MGETSKAMETIEQSFQAYENASHDHPLQPDHSEELQLLRQHLQAKTPPPPRVAVDIEAELSSAHRWLEVALGFNTHPLDQATEALLSQILGPAESIAEVLAAIDERHRKEGKFPIYFLPLDEPIAPHLDDLLGPMEPWDTSD